MALHEPVTLAETVVGSFMADVSAPSSCFCASPVRGTIRIARSVIYNSTTGADCTWSLKINGTAVTGSTATITQSGSAAGDVDSCEPTALNLVNVGDTIEFVSAGESSTTTPTMFHAVIRHG